MAESDHESHTVQPSPTRFFAPLLLFAYGFTVAFWLWAKWLFAPQMFFLPPLPPVEVLVSLVENVLGLWLVTLITLSSLALIGLDALSARRAGRLDWWVKSLLRGAAETVAIHIAVWIAGTILFFVILALMPAADVRGRSTNDPVVRGLLLFTAFLSLIMSGPITGLIMAARSFARQRVSGFPPTSIAALNHTVAILVVPLLLLWILSGYPRVTIRALRQSTAAQNQDASAALVAAAREGDAQAARSQLRRGAPPNARERSGATALAVAAANGHLETVRILIQAGADVNAGDETGRTALMSAATNRHRDIVEALLKARSNPNARDGEGKTALILASSGGDDEIVEMLLGAGAEVDATSKSGETALLAAARNGHTEIVRVLIGAGADFRYRDKNGETALKLALKLNRTETAQALRVAGAKD
jgi:ankyrin repeat protein